MAQFRTSFVEDLLSLVRLKYCTVVYSTTVEESRWFGPIQVIGWFNSEFKDGDFDIWRILVKE